MWFLAPLLGGLATVAGSLVGRVLLALGIGYVTYRGMNTSVNWCLDQIKANVAAMPPEIISFLGWLWVDKAISMVFAAYSAAALIRMAGSDKVTSMVTKGA